MRQYVVSGRKLPTEREPNPQIYRMVIFAPNKVVAESRFWNYMRTLQSFKKANGQLISITHKVATGKLSAKNYGFWIRYRSLKGVHNMYKEYRDASVEHAVTRLYNDMAGQYKVGYHNVDIIKIATLKPSQCKRHTTKMFHNEHIKFPQTFALAHFKRTKGSPFSYNRPKIAL